MKMKRLFTGAWHVYILMDRDSTERSKRRTAPVSQKLSHYNIGISAMSKIWFAGEGSLTESASGYAFFWKEKAV